jgi:uncharacterized membrane protein (Fun14 family)
MGEIIHTILSNKFYMIGAACLLGIIVYFIIKKAIKLFAYAIILLIAVLAYIYFFR